jgi:hypothetical protein
MEIDLTFDCCLNCGRSPRRGTGMSTVLEVIPLSPEEKPSLEGHAVQMGVQPQCDGTLLDSNSSGGRVGFTIETEDGMTHVMGRAADDKPILLDEAGDPLPVDTLGAMTFRADIYSQNGIESIEASMTAVHAELGHRHDKQWLELASRAKVPKSQSASAGRT